MGSCPLVIGKMYYQKSFGQERGLMSCMLRISGANLDVTTMLAQHPLPGQKVWRKGEPRVLKGKFHVDSGANVVVSEADFDQFDLQVTDATEILELHTNALANIVAYPGVEDVVFDFWHRIVRRSCDDEFVLPTRVYSIGSQCRCWRHALSLRVQRR
jgi:hypothetical protein